MMNEVMMNQEQHNAFVLEQVDADGWRDEEACPDCGKMAIRHDFESCHTGSVNAHYTLNCPHCGHHECDQDACSICESLASLTQRYYDEAVKWAAFFDDIETCLTDGRCVSGLLWTEFKYVVQQQPTVVSWLEIFFNLEDITAESLILHFKQQMATVQYHRRFN
ncbi:TPA: hypothetical protein ACVU43_004020 [Vibrio parahaemolyticus]|nr:hypothetical protein [Vibrio parahaemolyticus]HBC3831358.1 hypothetical protein [Vibrio parahaemolyticus]